MKQEEIKAILPHRDNMLLGEEAKVDGETAVGTYHVRGDEWFLQGHFPGNPVVPGVILCEMMAQATCVLLREQIPQASTPYFTSMNNVRFKSPVKPGDTFESRCKLLKVKKPFYFAEGKGYVDGKLSVKAELEFLKTCYSFALVEE